MTFTDYFLEKSGINFNYLLLYSMNASKKYFRFEIPKRDGSQRSIYHPAKKLKEFQRFLVNEIFYKLPTHDCVFSYRKGLSIKNMLLQHKNNNYTLRIDFINFFPSIKNFQIRNILQKYNDLNIFDFTLNELETTSILNIACRNNCLTIGAISSPQISNIILYDFDQAVHEYCTRNDIVYTRYADDLFFSSSKPNILKNILSIIPQILIDLKLNTLKINDKKTIHSSKKHNRTMTGLIITSDNKISIGLEKKNEIKRNLYYLKQGRNNITDKTSIGGYLSYIKSVEGSFFLTLQRKYGHDFINDLMRFKL